MMNSVFSAAPVSSKFFAAEHAAVVEAVIFSLQLLLLQHLLLWRLRSVHQQEG